MIVSLIAAIGKNRQLGKDNKMLWHIREDFKHFKETTMGHTLLMGRKTFDSIGRPLPGRETLILTRDKNFKVDNCTTVHSIEEAFRIAKERGETKLYVAGGGEVYRQALEANMVDELVMSFVDYDGEADTFFPEVDYSRWQEQKHVAFEKTEKAPQWDLVVYSRA